MKVKEAIEFLDHMANSFNCISSLKTKSINNKKNDIVELLQQGEVRAIMEEVYKKMWGILVNDLMRLREKAEKNNEYDELRCYSNVFEDCKRIENENL